MDQLANSEQQTPIDALRGERAALEAVRDALVAEHSALTDAEGAQLETAVAEKNLAIDALVHRRSEREAVIGRADLRKAVVAQYEDGSPAQRQALETVADLQQLGQECQRLNQRNGLLISGLRDMTANALGVLRGEPSVQLYGQSGERAENLSSRVIGTA
jgi:flagellar biosynthesis/type III secretory pathway chaperone